MKEFIKKLYGYLPETIKKLIAVLIRPLATPSVKLQQFLHFKGFFEVVIGNGKSFFMWHTGKWIENDLFWKGISGYEKVTMKVWMLLAQRSKSILDVGANTGAFSLVAGTVNKNSKIYSFEPLPQMFSILGTNITKNNLPIYPQPFAVSDYEGSSTFYFPEEGNIYSSTLSMQHYTDHNQSAPTEIVVKVTTLATFIEENKIENIDLIKIDAEGNDLQVLKGLKEYLPQFRPNIIIEIHNDELGQKIEELIGGLNYTYFDIDEVNIPVKIDSLRKSSSLNVLICRNEDVEIIKLLN